MVTFNIIYFGGIIALTVWTTVLVIGFVSALFDFEEGALPALTVALLITGAFWLLGYFMVVDLKSAMDCDCVPESACGESAK